MEQILNDSIESKEYFQADHLGIDLGDKNKKKLRKKKYLFLLILIILIVVIIILIITLNKEKKRPICKKGYFIPNDDLTNCEKCSENCEKCSGTKKNNICHYCNYGFYLFNGKCINYSFKAVYQSLKENEKIQLIQNFILKNIEEMYVDNENISPLTSSFNFSSPGNHTVLIYINISNLTDLSALFFGIYKMT